MKNISDNIIFKFQSSVASSNTHPFSDSASSANFDSMDSPSSVGDSIRVAARSSVIDSFRGCGLSGIRIDKEELKRIILLPQYLRLAMRDSINSKDPNAGDHHLEGAENAESPECPIIVFINSRSGGRHGPELKERLQELMSREQVFDLSAVKPHEFIQYGLGCLEKLAEQGDQCAKEVREKMRIVVAGGDGTVGWVLGSLGELDKQNREPVPPVGIIPLGTGNDLSRSFGWGGSFPFAWKSAVKRSLHRATKGPICRLDRLKGNTFEAWVRRAKRMICSQNNEAHLALNYVKDDARIAYGKFTYRFGQIVALLRKFGAKRNKRALNTLRKGIVGDGLAVKGKCINQNVF
ncbi:Diacylglycerol kinase 3 [Vitis vinifera]|uniref:Diacylglycerol kinase 3 n=1 Tax=Vitis vinifera TaxID=29760 RepID=A0A438CQ07_VITVI|nr:Diacylglycerol kinase 3 [Vitis vinifera]